MMAQKYLNITGGRKLPIIGIGTFTATDETQLEKALDTALETGYRHIDTAYFYNNEHLIGRVLKKWFDSGKLRRDDVFVTTKLPGCLSPDLVQTFLKLSLEKLQLDYLDLYLIHVPLNFKMQPGQDISSLGHVELKPSDIIATWKKLEEQVDLGLTKSIGVSNFNKDQVRRILEAARIIPATNQVELHVYLQQPELVKYCQDNGIAVVSYQSLGNPGLSGEYKRIIRPDGQFPNLLTDSVVEKIAAKHGKSTAQVLLKFLVQKNIAIIPKSVTPSRIRDNFNLFDFTLDSIDVRELESLDKGEDGRITFFDFINGCRSHPEYPF